MHGFAESFVAPLRGKRPVARIFTARADEDDVESRAVHVMMRILARYLVVAVTAAGVVAAGISLNLGILSNGHWGPGGLTLGASSDRSAAALTEPEVPSTTTTRRRVSTATTTPTTTVSTPVKPFTRGGNAQGPSVQAPDQPDDQPDTTPTTRRSTTTTQAPTTTSSDVQQHTVRVNYYVTLDVRVLGDKALDASLRFRNKVWGADHTTANGEVVEFRIHNATDEFTLKVWREGNRVRTSFRKLAHDS